MSTKNKSNPTSAKAKLTWQPKKTFQLEFSIPWDQVKTTYDQVLDQLRKDANIKGFRKGKAPKDVVEKSIDQGKIYGQVINQLLPISYAKAIKDHQLKPAIAPKVTIIKAEPNQSWQFKAVSCELPEVKLGDYQAIAKGALAKEKIWTPDKGSPADKSDQKDAAKSDTEKFNLISQALIKEISLDLPNIMVETESQRLLSKLLDQIQKLGLSIDQYAQNNGKTVDQIKSEYSQIAKNTLTLELILQAIAEDKKITVADKDIDAMINQAGDDKIKQKLNTPSERAYIATILRKKQVIDFLISL